MSDRQQRRYGNDNAPLSGRGNFGGAGGIARPDAKMSRRKTSSWPYFNNREHDLEVTSGVRGVLKHVSTRKRRQRDRDIDEP